MFSEMHCAGAELRATLDRRPFEPIRLHISSGQTVDIKYPDMAFVTRSPMVIGVADPDDRVADYAVLYNLTPHRHDRTTR